MSAAFLSVYDKTGIIDIARVLSQKGIDIISTGGTARLLRNAHIPVEEVSDITGFPELLGGRVKTLHAKIHAGILYKREQAEHLKEITEMGVPQIQFVIVNFYPFVEAARKNLSIEEMLDYIDIGGCTLARSAAKNFPHVTVVVDPADYKDVIQQVMTMGSTSTFLRKKLAFKAFNLTSYYDSQIAQFFQEKFHIRPFPPESSIPLYGYSSLRYGENPHQHAALYGDFWNYFQQLQGKDLSYNNILDIDAAVKLLSEFGSDSAVVAIFKHGSPCGVGVGQTLKEAYTKAYETDKESPFGAVIAVNKPLDFPLAEILSEIFVEVIVCPEFESESLKLLQKKKNLRLIQVSLEKLPPPRYIIRSLCANSYLLQDPDNILLDQEKIEVVSLRKPTAEEMEKCLFGWKVVKHVRSNAIVFSSMDRTLGIGAGQPSRVDSVRIAIEKARREGLSLKGSAIASDAFFPFPDGLELAAMAGATVAIQPGGSLRDKEVIEAANKHNMAMIFTHTRHFLH
ncbi:bifunctional phosphoribosylaminoimidazolecarboxamide formyltransferase/IMP cyclohydrolase [Methylacidiphilum caldifontis]|uniref:Bifunctional purine biosynthesis protein PurH n=1 Tax=Methylacidiphilum caldifontis TaxID=2795386 RepID=A0A4Y8PJF4_9BACT|nr:bifunctional phosphoribosylaminoimidazolecarboxamide formyltransferase/IMP cyclohydrolase [Methylacidiphilum caldifontis]QSR88943.1 bifunctional phosphoribosylaminoimidazolecarboxamide formyltransferase/IMP cyclohydrolase [Methylacidiphilum caldifontis]TFE71812.1 bifunctional phosphoribosylaminoimidazolecarboxamide formyltransferase/IMP cyclohydrolase [Methylacidiphilum caldifontis]